MKNRWSWGLAALLLMPASGAIAADDAPPADKQQSEEEKREAERRQKEFEKKMDERLDQLEKELIELKKKAETMGGKARDELNQQIEVLQGKKGDLRAKLHNLHAAWQDLESGLNAAMKELEKAYRRINERQEGKKADAPAAP